MELHREPLQSAPPRLLEATMPRGSRTGLAAEPPWHLRRRWWRPGARRAPHPRSPIAAPPPPPQWRQRYSRQSQLRPTCPRRAPFPDEGTKSRRWAGLSMDVLRSTSGGGASRRCHSTTARSLPRRPSVHHETHHTKLGALVRPTSIGAHNSAAPHRNMPPILR